QLGVSGAGSDDPVLVDLPLDGAAGFVEVAARANQSFALRSDGALYAWGEGTWGQLGIGSTEKQNPPTRVLIDTVVLSVAVGERHGLALDREGGVWSWGQNLHGELGTHPDGNLVTTPQRIPGFVGPVLIAAGAYHSLAV